MTLSSVRGPITIALRPLFLATVLPQENSCIKEAKANRGTAVSFHPLFLVMQSNTYRFVDKDDAMVVALRSSVHNLRPLEDVTLTVIKPVCEPEATRQVVKCRF
ncbi:unnamed protein product [Cylicostephanus goldi]|uniref:Uncharacterized protein n=1 Tax=Cylicostephanus goldi TaxID=71465 RepID=A0A3P7MQD2_CYLGO|nr:unnamed protein product [Cylicostephanus goldi]